MGRRVQRLFEGTRGHLLFILILVAIVGFEVLAFDELANTLPDGILSQNIVPALQGVITIAGLLVGASALLFVWLYARDSGHGRTFEVLVSMVVTVILFLTAALNAYYALLVVGVVSLSKFDLLAPVAFLCYGTSVLLFGVAVYMIRPSGAAAGRQG